MLQVTLLGEQVVRDAAGTVRVRSSRSLLLVAFLVVHAGSPQPRQRIAPLFWPDSTDDQALTNLRRELHHLRALLDDGSSLQVTTRDLCWQDAPDCLVDVREFARSRATALAAETRGDTDAFLAHAGAALDRYRGEFLPGGTEDWILEARAALEEQCVDLLDRVVAARSRAGDPAEAVGPARRRVQLRPLEEAGYRTLMALQAEAGDRAGAVGTYHRCASVLERELGVAPDPLTRSTLNRVLARGGPAPAPATAPARAGPAGTELVGRERELRVLQDRWRAAAAGHPGLVLLRGDAGVGKSRLMAELSGGVRRGGAVVADAQCFGTAGRLALAPVADWLRTPAIRSALTGLDDVWRTEVERLVPASRTRPDAGPPAMVDAWQRHRFHEGITRALLHLGRPVLLTIDNLHWCDPETLAFVTFCLALTPDAPILLVATVRDDPDDHEPGLVQWITRMRATGLLTEVPVPPFDAADTATLVEALTGRAPEPGEAALLQATTGGFPLYIVETARAGDGSGAVPDGRVTAVLVRRLTQTSPAAREIAGLGAAVGRDFTLDLLTEAADLDADAVVGAVDELWRARILRETADGYDFSHDLLRDAAYAQVSPPRRWLLHRRVAQGLEILHAADPDGISAQLAEQYARSGNADKAVAAYRRAADVAAGMFAHGEAVRLLEEALAIVRTLPEGGDRTRRELALLEAVAAPLNAQFGYSSPRLRETLEGAVARAEALGRRESLLNGLVGLWASLFVHGDTEEAHRAAGRALSLVEPDSDLSGPAHFAYGGSALSLGRPAEALEHLDLAAGFGGFHPLSIGTRSDVHGRAFAAHAHWLLGDPGAALTSSTDAIALARKSGNAYALAVALAYGAITHQLRDDRAELGAVVEELRGLCDRFAFAYYGDWGLVLDGWSRADASGTELVRAGIASLEAADAFARMPYWLALLADRYDRDGRRDDAVATLDAALAAGRAHDDLWWIPEVMRRRAAYDDPGRAVERLRTAAGLAGEQGSVALLVRCLADLEAHGVPAPAFGVRPAP
ncbi:SARP family transcriptional regulator [Pseudonocardia halophobica]|uniref:SARP family transcriptional regulator n=1 Tax=Pseudonocardia halophobica TaxID=29401 RepID=A0A9W6P1D4_9PSEU|nr:AAA family ATPase [Pseudonocardia halophobica]GLL16034.1 SARP family transcriptional regulator [Pseudonocardia halophobica]